MFSFHLLTKELHMQASRFTNDYRVTLTSRQIVLATREHEQRVGRRHERARRLPANRRRASPGISGGAGPRDSRAYNPADIARHATRVLTSALRAHAGGPGACARDRCSAAARLRRKHRWVRSRGGAPRVGRRRHSCRGAGTRRRRPPPSLRPSVRRHDLACRRVRCSLRR
jgi:hypothetical protein